MIGMGAEASTIVRAEAAGFFCNCGALKIPSDERVGDVPGSVHYHAQGLGLKSFQDFNVKLRFLERRKTNLNDILFKSAEQTENGIIHEVDYDDRFSVAYQINNGPLRATFH
jgi:hypothetical protein